MEKINYASDKAEQLAADFRVRVRHGSPDLPCPALSVAGAVNAVRSVLGDPEKLYISPANAVSDGWRDILAIAHAIVMDEDLEKIQGFNVVLKKHLIDRNPQENTSVMYLSVKDEVLNYLLEKRNSYQLMTNYVATPDYEDFTIRVFPAASMDTILDKLSTFGEVKLAEKDLKPLRSIPRISLQATIASVLADEEEKFLSVASEMGWFEYPRPAQATLVNIATRLGTTAPMLSIRLRNINRKLSEQYFRQYASPR